MMKIRDLRYDHDNLAQRYLNFETNIRKALENLEDSFLQHNTILVQKLEKRIMIQSDHILPLDLISENENNNIQSDESED